MQQISFDFKNAGSSVTLEELDNLEQFVNASHEMLHKKSGAGKDFLGWVELPINYDKSEFQRIKEAAKKIQMNSNILVVIGIGGSYLGAKAIIESLSHSFQNILPKNSCNFPKILFAGNNISSTYLSDLLDVIKDYDVSLNVISKSGTTTEPAIAFRILKEFMENKYGKEEAKKRIYATTDKSKGALFELSKREGYEKFIVPDDIGGRYSVLTAVGLLPIAVSGVNIDELLDGAINAYNLYNNPNLKNNDCYKYAAIRNILYRKNKTIEILVNYEPSLHYLAEWWKQLYGESEGKNGKGIFPAGVDYSTDLHSMGQYVQDGIRNIFETIIYIEKPKKNLMIKSDPENIDGLNYISGKDIDFVNKKAMEGTLIAHSDGGVPNLIISIPKLNEFYIGNLIYFFEKACGISGYLLGVNPFDQPGVEAYKKNMFALLGKAGYEEQRKALEQRLIF